MCLIKNSHFDYLIITSSIRLSSCPASAVPPIRVTLVTESGSVPFVARHLWELGRSSPRGQQTQKCLGIRMGDNHPIQGQANQSEHPVTFCATQHLWTPLWYLRNFPPYELPISPTVEVRYFQSQIVVSKRPQWSSPPCLPFPLQCDPAGLLIRNWIYFPTPWVWA